VSVRLLLQALMTALLQALMIALLQALMIALLQQGYLENVGIMTISVPSWQLSFGPA